MKGCRGPLIAEKGKDPDSPEIPEGTQPGQNLDFKLLTSGKVRKYICFGLSHYILGQQ